MLAKAAHDRGSMLASQRLRRAATYATNRELLRELIERPATQPQAAAAAPETVAEPVPENAFAATAAEVSFDSVAPAADDVTEVIEQPSSADIADVLLAEQEAKPAEATSTEAILEVESELQAPQPLELAETNTVSENEQLTQDVTPEADALEEAEVDESEPLSAEQLDSTPPIEAHQPAAEPLEDAVEETNLAPAEAQATEALADELPAVAPAIRPPVEGGSSRFEFGLAESLPPVTSYRLPEALEEIEPAKAPLPSFYADEHLAYAVAVGSRFGHCLMGRSAELTHDLPTDSAWLPDALLLDHAAKHRPATPATPSSIALIERFLKNQPRIKSSAARIPMVTEPQADLSVRSTSPPPSLASESLAKILVKQGKTARAIEIYEQLMVRQPEKKAYFAAQIDHLKQQPE
ncbi:hypothetical protein [Hymenobacter koreensis]|uniref:hypothetical protein n=1 Tax=Hymenobacter koreensis TaxID=1084523 RepID=UPI0031ED7B5A